MQNLFLSKFDKIKIFYEYFLYISALRFKNFSKIYLSLCKAWHKSISWSSFKFYFEAARKC